MRNSTCLARCVLALLTGFLIICLGAFFISSSSIFDCQGNLILAYLLLPLGFVILLSGIFWTTYHQVNESKGMFSDVFRQHPARGTPGLATVDRPDFYPPAYEESLDVEKQTSPAEGEALDVPPPPYTELDLEFEDDSDACRESPPSYDESMAGGGGSGAMQDAEAKPRGLAQGKLFSTRHGLMGYSC